MVHPLIGIHAALGELGIFAFVWVFVEMLNPTDKRIKRAKIAALLGLIFLLISWLAGGYYYVEYYGPNVKPLIKAGAQPWAHSVFMETKEHVFIFIPFLAAVTAAILFKFQNKLLQMKEATNSVLFLSGLIVLLGLSMAVMGYLISTGARIALEAKAG